MRILIIFWQLINIYLGEKGTLATSGSSSDTTSTTGIWGSGSASGGWEWESCHMCPFRSHQPFTMQILWKIIIAKVYAALDQVVIKRLHLPQMSLASCTCKETETQRTLTVCGLWFNIGVKIKEPGALDWISVFLCLYYVKQTINL